MSAVIPPTPTTPDDLSSLVLDVIRLLAPYDIGRDQIFYGWSDRRWDSSLQSAVPTEPRYSMSIECSDEFWWASADAEAVTRENFHLLKEALEECMALEKVNEGCMAILDAPLLFCARSRNIRPMKATYKDLDPWTIPLFDAIGPERDGDWAVSEAVSS